MRNRTLDRFVLEVRKKDGKEYAPNTLHHSPDIDFFRDARFAKFRQSLSDASVPSKSWRGLGGGSGRTRGGARHKRARAGWCEGRRG